MPDPLNRSTLERRHWENVSTAAARDLPPGRVGGVVAQLRQRGRVANRRADIFLAVVIVTVLTGLGYYIGLPIWRTYADGTIRTLQEQIAVSENDLKALDTRRAILIEDLRKALHLAPVVVRPATNEGFHNPLALADGTLIAPGWSGTILRSIDGGATWTEARARSETDEGFYTPLTLADGTLITGGKFGTILRSTDGGATWIEARARSEPDEGLPAMLALANGTLIAVGRFGTILRSTDSGATWTEARTRSEPEGSPILPPPPIALANGTLIAARWSGMILRSIDDGVSWTEARARSETDEGFYTPLILADKTLIAAGESGTMLRSTDDGENWSEVRTQSNEGFGTPLALADGTLIALGQFGTILRSTDSGATWPEARARSDPGEGFYTPLALTDGTLIAPGNFGTILRSIDGGATWTETRARSKPGEGFYTLFALAEGTLITGGKFGTILRSTNDGASWTEVRTRSATDEGFNTPLALTDGTLIAAGYSGTILRFSDDTSRDLSDLAKDLEASGTGDGLIANFLETLAPEVRNTKPVSDLVSTFGSLRVQRQSIDAILLRARERLEGWRSGQTAVEMRQRAFATFMRDCRAGAAEPEDASLTKACLEAFVAGEADQERDWWETLAEQVPPGILLLFLLATLSGLYRYNVRLAGFHNGRADALELMVAEASFERLTPLADALAADKVEFGAAKTPTDHAAEMATALINRVK